MKFAITISKTTDASVGTTEMSIYPFLRKEMEKITWQNS